MPSLTPAGIRSALRNRLGYWPNDCPACGKRMKFAFQNKTAHRKCKCGKRVFASDVFRKPIE